MTEPEENSQKALYKRKKAILKQRLEDEKNLNLKIYEERNLLAQALVLTMIKDGHTGGVRVVGDMDPDWPVIAACIDNGNQDSEISFHICEADFKSASFGFLKYPYAWKLEDKYNNAPESERYKMLHDDKLRVKRNLERLISSLSVDALNTVSKKESEDAKKLFIEKMKEHPMENTESKKRKLDE
jgi:hypothetical protein